LGDAYLLVGVSGDANDAIRTDYVAGIFGGKIVLANVDAIKVGQYGEVRAVVHDELAAAACHCFAKNRRPVQHLLWRAVLIAVLHQTNARRTQLAGKVSEQNSTRRKDFGIDNDVQRMDNHFKFEDNSLIALAGERRQ
jgi:hypothetical protein